MVTFNMMSPPDGVQDEAVQAKRTAFLQWRLGHDHGFGSRDIADAFGIPEADALAMLRGGQPVPESVVTAGKAALNAWHSEGHKGDIRTYFHHSGNDGAVRTFLHHAGHDGALAGLI